MMVSIKGEGLENKSWGLKRFRLEELIVPTDANQFLVSSVSDRTLALLECHQVK